MAGDRSCERSRSKRKNRKVWRYGNMPNYYTYRTPSCEDHRLAWLPRGVLRQCDVLDVGAHEGLLALSVAAEFQPRYIEGVDIDERLVKRSIRKLTTLRRAMNSDKNRLKHTRFYFRQADFVHEQPTEERFHTVLLLSVLKWVQLNGGDSAVHSILHNCFVCLKPGGTLVLEIQPLKSYKASLKKYDLPQDMRRNLQQMQVLPDTLEEYAAHHFAFKLVCTLQPRTQTGFARRIVLLRKQKPDG